MRIIHIEKRDEEKKRDEEVESLKIQLKELKPNQIVTVRESKNKLQRLLLQSTAFN